MIKAKILEGLRYKKNHAPRPVTHSPTYTIHPTTHTLTHSGTHYSLYSFQFNVLLFSRCMVVFITSVPICGNAFNNRGCKNATWTIQNLLCIFEWCLALAFVPPNNVQNSFDQLAALIRNQYGNGADGVLDYFEDNYVRRFHVIVTRVIPKFPIDFWNMFNRKDDELLRTNNAVEGWHRGFQAHVSACHHVLWKFEVLQKKETVAGLGILQN